MHPALERTSHRPWRLPEGAWAGRQSWRDLAFLHWPIEVERVRDLVPRELEIQQFGGSSWIGIVPFRMAGVMLRGLPDLPGISAFPELNVRLYVEHQGKAGVWFLSLDADHALAVWAARTFMHLPYFRARISLSEASDGIDYRCVRRGAQARFAARYRALSGVYEAAAGSLEHWLTERYCLYARSPAGTLMRTEVHHWPWPLQTAEAAVAENTLLDGHGLAVPAQPVLVHFARRLDVVVWPPQTCVTSH